MKFRFFLFVVSTTFFNSLILYTLLVSNESENFKDPRIRILKTENNDDDFVKFSWVNDRLTNHWFQWYDQLNRMENNLYRTKSSKRILVLIGSVMQQVLVTNETEWRKFPLGEFLQWTDLIGSLKVMKSNFRIISQKKNFNDLKNADTIITDYSGMWAVLKKWGSKEFQKIKCKFRVIDSFGTEAYFNVKPKSNGWGVYKLHLKQFYTYFPHSPDNSFLGFSVTSKKNLKKKIKQKENIAVVYGKKIEYFHRLNLSHYMTHLAKEYKIYLTMDGDSSLLNFAHENLGVLSQGDLYAFLNRAKLFIGLGFPFEGPGPLEATARGCIFINLKFNKPMGKRSEAFFKSKPTTRMISSQNPYMEEWIGEPMVYTFNPFTDDVKELMAKIRKQKITHGYIPHEVTLEGFVEKVKYLIENHEFCSDDPRIGTSEFPYQYTSIVGKINQSCHEACLSKNLFCENFFFPDLNKKLRLMTRLCENISYSNSFTAPYIVKKTPPECVGQNDKVYFSCIDKPVEHQMRICPCRKRLTNNSEELVGGSPMINL